MNFWLFIYYYTLASIGLSIHILLKLSLAKHKNPKTFDPFYFIKDNYIDIVLSAVSMVIIIIFLPEIVSYICATPCTEYNGLYKIIAFTGGLFNTELLRKFKQLIDSKYLKQ